MKTSAGIACIIACLVGPARCFSVDEPHLDRRGWLANTLATATTILCAPSHAAEFTPGGSLVDRNVGPTVGNPEASPSRKFDNSNVLFDKDYYFKFGNAAVWIAPDSTDFPTTMPFTKSQQRYDTLKKYQERVNLGVQAIQSLKDSSGDIPDPTSTDVYYLRPMGLLANGMLASENTGAPNELFLARWYINEMYLLISDLRNTSDKSQRQKIYGSLRKAVNSYLTLMNRVISSKVGDKFQYI